MLKTVVKVLCFELNHHIVLRICSLVLYVHTKIVQQLFIKEFIFHRVLIILNHLAVDDCRSKAELKYFLFTNYYARPFHLEQELLVHHKAMPVPLGEDQHLKLRPNQLNHQGVSLL